MKLQIFSMYDKKAKAHLTPFFFAQKGQALRELQNAVKNDKTMVHSYPGDYSLWKLGDFDDNSGLIEPLAKPEFIEEAFVYAEKQGE